ncbi:MAG TPA: TonB-dependent receptor [Rhizomicrobium sp.]
MRSILLTGAASATLVGIATSVEAQDTSSQTTGSSLETVVVTGSRIPQTGIYSASPVTAVGQQELKFEGTTDVTSLINNLPEAFVDQNQGVSNGSTGTANVDLRGLGSTRTLVLVNGTRLMPGDPQDPVADLNDIPAALVDHVEVLTGGASAVYGSDALAGVVNFIMRKDFQGVEVDGTYTVAENDNDVSRWRGLTQDQINGGAYGFSQSKEDIWDGETADATLLMGTNTANDKGNITAYLSYRNSQPVVESTRDYSECTIASLNTTTGSTSTGPFQSSVCSGSSNYNRFLSLDNAYGGYNADYFVQGKNPGGNFVPYTGAANQHFNYGGLNYLQRSDTRYTAGFFAHYQENKQLDIYSSFMFSDDYTVAQLAQSGLFLGAANGPSGSVYVNCSNPYLTSLENYDLCGQLPGDAQQTTTLANGQKFTYWNGAGNTDFNPYGLSGQANLYIGRRGIEAPDREFFMRHTAYRMQLGARGDLGNGWSYDVYAQYGLTLADESTTGNFSLTRIQNSIEVDPTTGKCFVAESQNGTPPLDNGCVPMNIFTGLGSISPQALKYVLANSLTEGFTQEQIVSGNITGDLGEYGLQSPWAKNPVAVSFGSEYRAESLEFGADYESQTFDLSGSGGASPVPEAGYNVVEGFTEVKVPLIQGMPWIQDLSLNGGYRYSSYSSAGSTNTYKYGAEWQPIDDFRLRASMQRAVRTPNVLELFSPVLSGANFSGQDPCYGATGIVYKNCVNNKYAPVSAAAIASGILYCPATQCAAEVGGNAALKPEVSDTRTAGIVFTPTFLDGFTATVDWFDIKVDNYISTLPPQEILNDCYGASASAESMAYFCPFVHRSVAGIVYGGGYVSDLELNTGYLQTKGVDFELNYQTDLSNIGISNAGSLSFNLIGTYLDTLTTEPVPQGPLTRSIQQPFDCAGLYGLVCSATSDASPNPKWRHKLRVTWTSPWDVDFSAQWRYIGGTSLDADSSNILIGGSPANSYTCANGQTIHGVMDCPDARLAPYDYFDLSGDWTIRQGVDLRAGVNNIFDVEPPIIGTQALPVGTGNGNTFTGLYDSLGRTIFIAGTVKY